MAITQLTHLHLTIPSSGSTMEPVPPECFQTQVGWITQDLLCRACSSDWREELDSPEKSLPEDTLHHDREAAMIAPPTYVLSVDPFEEEELLSPPRFPFLPAPPGFAPLSHPGDLPGHAGMAY